MAENDHSLWRFMISRRSSRAIMRVTFQQQHSQFLEQISATDVRSGYFVARIFFNLFVVVMISSTQSTRRRGVSNSVGEQLNELYTYGDVSPVRSLARQLCPQLPTNCCTAESEVAGDNLPRTRL